jgi:hypothetical protein
MGLYSKTREAITQAGQSVADAMKVAIFACVLAVVAVLMGLAGLYRTRPAAA